MAANVDNPFKNRTRALTLENIFNKSPDMWITNKRLLDNVGDLWRVHNALYDVSDFVDKHPGGRFWLEATKGTDITEAFESHHIVSTLPEETLKKYYVREVTHARQSPYTFHDDGFYRTLKRNVRGALKNIPRTDTKLTDIYTDCLMSTTFIFVIMTSWFWNYHLAALSGIFCGMTVIASHNYIHKRDNFRMHYSELGMLQSRDFRIVHVLSHHFYPNTVADTQVYFAEPYIISFPEEKSFILKYGSWVYGPLLFWPIAFLIANIISILGWTHKGRNHKVGLNDFLPLVMPATIMFVSGKDVLAVFALWQFIITTGSFTFCLLAFTNSHIHPDIYMEGDTPRSNEEMDWGINQLDTISDRHEVMGNRFLTLVSFGDHALHHLFPTLDHGILHHLYPVVRETMKQFHVDIRMISQADMFTGYFRQLAREKINQKPPNLLTNIKY